MEEIECQEDSSQLSIFFNKEQFWPGVRKSVWRIEFGLYLSLFIKSLLPTIYSSVRIHILGDLPSDSGVNIASQVVWLSLFYEVLQEMFILPLFYTFGSSISDLKTTANKIKTGLVIISIFFTVSSVILYFLMPTFVDLMAQNTDLFHQTVSYVRLEVFGFIFTSLNSFLMIPVELLQMKTVILVSLVFKMIFTVILDFFFLSSYDFSLQLGVDGIAYSNICTGVLNTLLLIIFLGVKLQGCWSSSMSFSWVTEWFRVGLFSGFDSLVRNLVYMVVILRSMNQLSEAGLYWTTNTFIWSYILLPFLPLSELLKLDISAENNQELHHTRKMSGYIILTLLIISFWIIIVPLWSVIFKYLLNVEDPGEHVDLALILFPFYIFFMLGDLLTGVMYSLGRTDFIALKSLLGNIIIAVLFSLSLAGVIPLSLISVSLIFGAGLTLGCVTSTCLYYILIKKNDFKI